MSAVCSPSQEFCTSFINGYTESLFVEELGGFRAWMNWGILTSLAIDISRLCERHIYWFPEKAVSEEEYCAPMSAVIINSMPFTTTSR